MHRRQLIALPVAGALVVGLVAPAQGDVSAAALKHRATVKAATGNDLKFNKAKLRVKRGKVTIVMTNPGSNIIDHGVAVARKGKDKVGKTVGPGGKSRVRVKLKRGKYTFYCPVPGHRAGGMHGKLIVK
jgi:uncharacterized cupredoxin-like copper-binding protein